VNSFFVLQWVHVMNCVAVVMFIAPMLLSPVRLVVASSQYHRRQHNNTGNDYNNTKSVNAVCHDRIL
jgi:hypothetical protein